MSSSDMPRRSSTWSRLSSRTIYCGRSIVFWTRRLSATRPPRVTPMDSGGRRSIRKFTSGCNWWPTSTASLRNGNSAKTSTTISLLDTLLPCHQTDGVFENRREGQNWWFFGTGSRATACRLFRRSREQITRRRRSRHAGVLALQTIATATRKTNVANHPEVIDHVGILI